MKENEGLKRENTYKNYLLYKDFNCNDKLLKVFFKWECEYDNLTVSKKTQTDKKRL